MQLTKSSRKKAAQTQHYDKLGVEIFPGDFVAAPDGYRAIKIAKVVKLNPKMLTLSPFGSRWNTNTYSSETIKLDPALVTMYMLRNKIG